MGISDPSHTTTYAHAPHNMHLSWYRRRGIALHRCFGAQRGGHPDDPIACGRSNDPAGVILTATGRAQAG